MKDSKKSKDIDIFSEALNDDQFMDDSLDEIFDDADALFESSEVEEGVQLRCEPFDEDGIKWGHVPVVFLQEAVAVPYICQQLPQTVDINDVAINEAISKHSAVVVVYVKTLPGEVNDPAFAATGIIGRIEKIDTPSQPDSAPTMLFKAGYRVRCKGLKFSTRKGFHTTSVKPIKDKIDLKDTEFAAYLMQIQTCYDEILKFHDQFHMPTLKSVAKEYNGLMTLLYAIFMAPMDPEVKNKALAAEGLREMCEIFLDELMKNLEFQQFRQNILKRTNRNLADNQREAFIHQEMAVLREELGEDEYSDIKELRKRAETKKWNEATLKHFDRELAKLQRYLTNTPDYSLQYSYIDTFLSLPWESYTESEIDFQKIEDILNRDHFGLEKVKERILEQMAVAKLRDDNKAPILCLVGPPGVGKTSLGKSIADAMGRDYARVSFGGMHDEAEIRGRRTYLGAMAGRIITALIKAGHSNPVMVLDEIDKIGRDFKGDPSTALLEVLDPEQNSHFHDNYIDADYDLSKILFIATANSLETISAPLLDRMEIIAIPGYITAEKVEIGKRHLVPKELRENGFDAEEISFTDDALVYLIDYYTRESGVRKLQKRIAKVLRKLAVKKVRGEEYPRQITPALVKELLGKEEYTPEMYENNDYVGVVTGLAWTSVGGEILFIEASVTEGKGKLTLTGNLGNVMKESATIALQYLRAHASLLGMKAEDFDKRDFHIHVPEGAIPKDGPSAGITMTTALASALSGRKVRSHLAMTGETTLRGKVLPVGGIKEKIIAAKRAGITRIILSRENEKDILEVPARYLEGLEFSYVSSVGEVLDIALIPADE